MEIENYFRFFDFSVFFLDILYWIFNENLKIFDFSDFSEKKSRDNKNIFSTKSFSNFEMKISLGHISQQFLTGFNFQQQPTSRSTLTIVRHTSNLSRFLGQILWFLYMLCCDQSHTHHSEKTRMKNISSSWRTISPKILKLEIFEIFFKDF